MHVKIQSSGVNAVDAILMCIRILLWGFDGKSLVHAES